MKKKFLHALFTVVFVDIADTRLHSAVFEVTQIKQAAVLVHKFK